MAASRTMAAAPASVASAESGRASRWIHRSMHCWRVGSSVSACGATVRGTYSCTVRPRLVRVRRAYCAWAPRRAALRLRYLQYAGGHVQYGDPGTCVSAQGGALISCSCSAGEKDAGKSTALDLGLGLGLGLALACVGDGASVAGQLEGRCRLAEAGRGWRPPCA